MRDCCRLDPPGGADRHRMQPRPTGAVGASCAPLGVSQQVQVSLVPAYHQRSRSDPQCAVVVYRRLTRRWLVHT